MICPSCGKYHTDEEEREFKCCTCLSIEVVELQEAVKTKPFTMQLFITRDIAALFVLGALVSSPNCEGLAEEDSVDAFDYADKFMDELHMRAK